MLRSRFLIIAFKIAISPLLYGQSITILDEIKPTGSYAPIQTEQLNENGDVVLLSTDKKDYRLSLVSQNKFTDKSFIKDLAPRSLHESHLIKNGDSVWLVTSEMNIQAKIGIVTSHLLSPTFTKMGKEQTLIEFEFKRKAAVKDPKLFYAKTTDDNFIVFGQTHTGFKKDEQSISITVTNRNFVSLWGNDLVLPYLVGNCDIDEIAINSKDEVFLLLKHYTSKLRINQSVESRPYEYILLKVTDKGIIQNTKIGINNSEILSATMGFSDSNFPVVGGFLKTGKDYNFFTLSFENSDLSKFSDEHKALPKDLLIINNIEDKSSHRSQSDFRNFKFQHVIKQNNSTYLFGEFEHSFLYRASSESFATIVYKKNSILCTKINKNGEIEWIKKIPKIQRSDSDNGYFLGYEVKVIDNDIRLIFNDYNIETEVFDENSEVKQFRPWIPNVNASLRTATIDELGSLRSELIEYPIDSQIHIKPQTATIHGSVQCLLIGLSKKPYRHYLMKLEK